MPRRPGLRGRAPLGLLAGCLALYLIGAGGYDLLTDDEMRYAEAGRMMVATGDWVLPWYNGYPRYQKPIFFYWLQALAQAWCGGTLAATRLPSALAGAGVVLLTYWQGALLWGRRAGLWAGVVLATSLEMVLLSRMVMTDVVLLLFVQGALTAYLAGRLTARPDRRRRWRRLGFGCLALGVLTKGPVAVVLPAAGLGLWLLARGELRRALRPGPLLEGLGILLAVAGPWYWWVDYQTVGQFTRHFFLEENLGRFTAVINEHHQPAAFYLLLLVPMTFPWTGLIPAALRQAVRAPLRGASVRRSAPWLFLGQIVLVLGLFTASKTRVWTYVLPLFPPLALLVGRRVAGRRPTPPGPPSLLGKGGDQTEDVGLNPPRSRSDLPPSPLRGGGAGGGEVAAAGGGEVAPALLTFLLLSLLGAATLTLFGDRLTLADGVPPGPVTFALQACAWLLAGVALVTYRAARQGGQYLALGWLAGGVALWYLAVVLIAVPAYDRVWKQPLREAAAAVRGHDHDHPKAVIYCLHELGLNFHTGIPVVRQWREGAIPDLADLLASNEPIFVFLPPDRLGDLEGLPFHVWGQNPRFLWGANRPRPAGSAGGPAPARTPSRSIPARPVSHR